MLFESLWLTPLLVFLLLMISALCSGAETAITTASKARLHKMAKGGDLKAKLVRRLQSSSQRVISVLLMANNLVNVFASALATGFLIHLLGDKGVVAATVIMTFLILLFAEVAPKLYAIQNSISASKKVARFADFLIHLLSPPARTFEKMATFLIRPALGSASRQAQADEEELEGAIDIHGMGGAPTAKTEGKMLRGILDLDDVTVSHIMVHKKEVFSLNVETTVGEAMAQMAGCGFTRVPLRQGDTENITGVLHAKSLLDVAVDSPIAPLATDPWFIPESTSLLAQLQEFKTRRSHFALVVDEYGVWQGIVTLEDILEEIVGDITDEFDRQKSRPRLMADGSVTVAGDYPLRDLNRLFDWELPDEEAATIGGFIEQETRTIPGKNRRFSFYGFDFEVLEGNERVITLVKVLPPYNNGAS